MVVAAGGDGGAPADDGPGRWPTRSPTAGSSATATLTHFGPMEDPPLSPPRSGAALGLG